MRVTKQLIEKFKQRRAFNDGIRYQLKKDYYDELEKIVVGLSGKDKVNRDLFDATVKKGNKVKWEMAKLGDPYEIFSYDERCEYTEWLHAEMRKKK